MYCSPACGFESAKVHLTTERQYENISGNWDRYFDRLLNKKDRQDLTRQNLLDLYNGQDGICALSGRLLTCNLIKGVVCLTNASIDRIIPSDGYQTDNIRLVCRIANIMKWSMSDDELRLWCERILDYGREETYI